MKKVLAIAVIATLPWVLAGCGEGPAVTVYKQGKYQGKPDASPWENDRFKGDKVAWESEIKRRNQGQNEYSRGTPTPQ